MLDGLEKVTRLVCTLPKSKVVAGQDSETSLLNIVQCCPETPVLGGKHAKPSKFCTAHTCNQENQDALATQTSPEIQYMKSRVSNEVAFRQW